MTVVADASALVVAVLDAGAKGRRARLAIVGGSSAPHLVDAEVGQAIRGLVLRGVVEPEVGRRSLDHAASLVEQRFPHAALRRLAWSWRSSITFFDGMYVALAALLELPLVTADARLAAAVGPMVDVELV